MGREKISHPGFLSGRRTFAGGCPHRNTCGANGTHCKATGHRGVGILRIDSWCENQSPSLEGRQTVLKLLQLNFHPERLTRADEGAVTKSLDTSKNETSVLSRQKGSCRLHHSLDHEHSWQYRKAREVVGQIFFRQRHRLDRDHPGLGSLHHLIDQTKSHGGGE